MTHIATNSAIADAGIEITPEMIKAGRKTLYKFDIMHPIENEMNEAVRAVFISMLGARP